MESKTPIEELGLSARAYNCLKHNGVNDLGTLLTYDEQRLGEMRNMGRKSVDEIVNMLKKIGLRLGQKADFTVFKEPAERIEIPMTRIYLDIPFSDFRISKESVKSLNEQGIYYLSDYALAKQSMNDKWSSLPRVVRDLLDKRLGSPANYVMVPVVQSQTALEIIESEDMAESLYHRLGGQLETWLSICKGLRGYAFNKEMLEADLRGEYAIRRMVYRSINREFERNRGEVSLEWVYDEFSDLLTSEEDMLKGIEEMYPRDVFYLKDDVLGKKYFRIQDYIDRLKEENPRCGDILSYRVHGLTLQETGDKCNLTRERVRQIEARLLRRRVTVYEDRYRYLFDNYMVTEKNFQDILPDEPLITFYYLRLMNKTGLTARKPIEQAINDEKLPDDIRSNIPGFLHKDNVIVDGESIPANSNIILQTLIRNHCQDPMRSEDLAKLYNSTLDDLGLTEEDFSRLDAHAIDTRIDNHKMAVSNNASGVRYYDFKAHNPDALFKRINLGAYNGKEISTALFLRKDPALMDDFDIRDEYELHNILRMFRHRLKVPIVFKRMPMITIGDADRLQQILKIYNELKPCSMEILSLRYEMDYGVRTNMFLANFMPYLTEYLYAQTLKQVQPGAPQNVEKMLTRYYKENGFYTMSDAFIKWATNNGYYYEASSKLMYTSKAEATAGQEDEIGDDLSDALDDLDDDLFGF